MAALFFSVTYRNHRDMSLYPFCIHSNLITTVFWLYQNATSCSLPSLHLPLPFYQPPCFQRRFCLVFASFRGSVDFRVYFAFLLLLFDQNIMCSSFLYPIQHSLLFQFSDVEQCQLATYSTTWFGFTNTEHQGHKKQLNANQQFTATMFPLCSLNVWLREKITSVLQLFPGNICNAYTVKSVFFSHFPRIYSFDF